MSATTIAARTSPPTQPRFTASNAVATGASVSSDANGTMPVSTALTAT